MENEMIITCKLSAFLYAYCGGAEGVKELNSQKEQLEFALDGLVSQDCLEKIPDEWLEQLYNETIEIHITPEEWHGYYSIRFACSLPDGRKPIFESDITVLKYFVSDIAEATFKEHEQD